VKLNARTTQVEKSQVFWQGIKVQGTKRRKREAKQYTKINQNEKIKDKTSSV